MRTKTESIAAVVLTMSVFVFLTAIAFGWIGQG